MNFKLFINGTTHMNNGDTIADEMALVDMDTEKILYLGDFEHHQIYERISAFLRGLDYGKVKYKLKTEIIVPKRSLFDDLGFHNKNY